MNDAQILEQLAATDAYAPAMQRPLDAWTDDVTFAEIEGRISVQTQQTKPPVVPSSSRRHSGWLVAAAAFAAVIIMGVVIVLTATGGGEGEPATTVPSPSTTEALPTPEPKQIAADFVEARSNWDGAAMEALLGPGATLAGEIAITPSDYPMLAEFDRALGQTYSLGECSQAAVLGSTTVRVSCLYTFENDWSRALDIDIPQRLPSEGGNVFTFEIVDGKIQYVEVGVTQAFLDRVLSPFIDWLEGAHPDDVDLMFVVGPRAPWPGSRPLLNADALALWERYSKEFVDFINASG
jgi:hypothetical protein